jgi:hypothetical protein
MASIWCEHCRDHFPESHYDENGAHAVGAECGPCGDLLAAREERDELLRRVEELERQLEDAVEKADGR